MEQPPHIERQATERGKRAGEARLWRDSSYDGVSILAARYEQQRFPAHAHGRFVIAAILGGQAVSRYDGRRRTVGSGSLVIIPPGMIHDGRPVGFWEHFAIYCPEDFLAGLLHTKTESHAAPRVAFPRLFYSDPDLYRSFVRAARTFLAGDDPMARESAMIEALGLLTQRHGVARRSGLPRLEASDRNGRRQAVGRSLELMRERLGRTLTIRDLADAAGYSKFHFLRVFKAETGRTPHAYLMQCRIKRARERLRSGEAIADAAYETGFADQAHFTRRFKELTGVTPGEFLRGSQASASLPWVRSSCAKV
jgi:AraC-like DNA-binding protein/mannose-6-phosphate isomerase-like protein (cupin superfamily)